MDIAVAYDKFGKRSASGARVSLHTLLDGLPDAYSFSIYDTVHQDEAVPDFVDSRQTVSPRQIPTFVWTNQVLYRWQWRNGVRERFEANEHDVVITQGEIAPATVQIAAETDTPSIFFLRSLQVTGTEKFDPRDDAVENFARTDLGGRVQFPFLARNVRAYRRALETADVVVTNSDFTAERVRERFGVDSTVIYPPITLSDYRVTSDPDGKITMVNPRSADKGVDIFLDIAERLPDEEFLLVGTVSPDAEKRRAQRLDNVTLHGWTDDVREAYGQSKLVVVPSRYEEPFGRVAAEAMVSAIPCVVSNRGGLPEVVGETGEIVDAVESERAWINAIERALATDRGAAQRERVERFAADKQVEKLRKLVERAQSGRGTGN
ncbi:MULTISPECIES: glycosyltransferase family 4 protein [Halomicrobium]|uniref:Glycosyl transferase group 1 n=2 Tax=Halomicrobium mukohataei TaxID=57705 RepID=C7P384_HALMD|nr:MULTISPECIES: glycosyltransferase family 4 protein [Halomicrobium]ACV47556.1 glycosyl transferase group 1 [Halomicrobium mukohataei DSM 12286]QCD66019.1 glycosyltransferase [Halomicrobium mukohataei]QFR20824.1 glycosyltransferase [Halomicrobium sp. ZPS1]